MAMTARAKKRIALLLGVVVVIGGAALGIRTIRRANLQSLVRTAREQGMQAFEQREYERAIERLGYYVRNRRNDADAVLALAVSRRAVPMENARHLVEALGLARHAVELEPDNLEALELVLGINGDLGRAAESIDAAEAILKDHPSHRDALIVRVDAYRSVGKREEAVRAADDLIAAYPDDAAAHLLRLQSLRLAGETTQSLRAEADRLADNHPNSVPFLLLRTRVLGLEGDSDGALSMLRRAAALPPPDAATMRELIGMLDQLRLGPWLDAAQRQELGASTASVLDRALADPTMAREAELFAAERAWKKEHLDEARSRSDAAATPIDTATDRALGWAALIRRSMGDDATSIEDVLGDRHTEEASYWRRLSRAVASVRDNQFSAARDTMRALAHEIYADGLLHGLLGLVEADLGERVEAIESLTVAARQEPAWALPRRRLASLLLETGRVEEAYQLARSTLDIDPGRSLDVFGDAFVALSRTGRLPEAEGRRVIAMLRDGVAHATPQAEYAAWLARLIIASGDAAQAADLIDIVRDGPGVSVEALISLAHACREAGLAQADELVARARSIDPAAPGVVLADARALARAGDWKAGLEALKHARDRSSEPQSVDAMILQFLREGTAGPEQAAEIAAYAANHPSDVRAQLVLLDSSQSWAHPEMISQATTRLRSILGENAATWRLYEARRLLRLEPGRVAEVPGLLGPLTSGAEPSPDALAIEAEALWRQNLRNEAIAKYSRSLDISRANPVRTLRLVGMLQQLGRAIEARQRLLELLPNPLPTVVQRDEFVRLLISQGMIDEAINVLERSGDDSTLAQRAQLQRLAQRPDRARDLFEQLLARQSLTPDELVAAADFVADSRGVDAGLEVLNRLGDDVAATDRHAITSAYLERHGRTSEAVSLLEESARSSQDARTWTTLGWLHVRRGDLVQAGRALDQAALRAPDDPEVASLRGVLAIAEGQSVDASALSEIAMSVGLGETNTPVFQEVMAVKSELAAGTLAWPGVVDRLRRLVDEHPTSYIAWKSLAGALVEQGDLAGAADAAQRAAAAMPMDSRPAELATTLLAMAGNFDQGLAMAREWRRRVLSDAYSPDTAIARLSLALRQMDTPREWARRYRDRVVAGATDRPRDLVMLAQITLLEGHAGEARSMLTPYLGTSETIASLFLSMGSALLPDIGAAEAWLNAGEGLLGDGASTKRARAQAWHDLARQSGRTTHFQHVIDALEPLPTELGDEPLIRGMLASAYEALGDLDRAESHYRRAVELAPTHPAMLNNLAYLMVKKGTVTAQALDWASQALRIGRERRLPPQMLKNLMDTQGSVQLALSRFEDAERTFAEALRLVPTDPALVAGRAQALLGLSRAPDALLAIDAFFRQGTAIPEQWRQRLNDLRARALSASGPG